MASLVAAVPVFAIAQIDAVSEPQDSGPEESVSDDGEPNLRESENTAAAKDADQLGSEPQIDDNNDLDSELSSQVPAGNYAPTDIRRWGFIYLFVIESLILLRLMLDPLMVRRPLLDPNLTTGGLNFIGISLFIFMMANVVTSTPRVQVTQGPALGPGYALMNIMPAIPTRPISDAPGGVSPPTTGELTPSQSRLATIAKVLAILAHLAIVSGIVLIGNRHFSNLRAGVGCATLYLMLPYTAQMTGRVDHALPAALLLWAVLFYRKPMVAGIFLGLAGGLVYYPLFLLPLWFSFYWQRGARHFAVGVVAMLALLMIALSFDDSASLLQHLRRMFGFLNPNRDASELRGIWGLGWNPIWRLPVIVAFVILKRILCDLAGAKEPRNSAKWFGGLDGGSPVLARVRRRPVHRVVLAIVVVNDFSAESAGSRGDEGGCRRCENEP